MIRYPGKATRVTFTGPDVHVFDSHLFFIQCVMKQLLWNISSLCVQEFLALLALLHTYSLPFPKPQEPELSSFTPKKSTVTHPIAMHPGGTLI